MRSLYPALLASLLVLSPVACKRNGSSGGSSPSDSTTARPKGPKLPKPLKLPADPEAVVHVKAPKTLMTEVLAYAGSQASMRQVIQQALQASGRAFETRVFAHVGLGRSWNMAVVGGQTIVHVPVRNNAANALAAQLAEYAPEGDFGAVRIPRPQGEAGPKLAFFDRDNLMLTLADDLRGIATGPELGRTYGKQDINIAVTAQQAARYGAELGARKVTITGDDPGDIRIQVDGAPALPPDLQFTEGALTGLLESEQVAVGGSTKYSNYKKDVDNMIRQGRRQVSSLPGMAQGNAKDLLNRASAVLRNWNGRTMVGVGPANHVLLGFGADDPGKMSNATLYLMRGVLSNIKTIDSLRKFGVKINVPRVRFAPNKAKVGDDALHVVALENARKYLPPEMHPLITDDNRLRVAFAFPQRSGAGMLVVGRNADRVLTTWLQQTKKATPGNKSTGHLASATVAVGPKAFQRVAQADFDPTAILGLSANRPSTRVTFKRKKDGYVVKLKRQASPSAGRANVSTP